MIWLRAIATLVLGLALAAGASDAPGARERLWHHRNLGKAYYENPMTQMKAVEEFKEALDLSPDSARDRVNYGLALLRAGMSKEAIVQLQKAQKADPSIPHTWFNLGMAYKKEFENQRAIEQLEGMLKLVPDEPVTHYNLGVLYKLAGDSGKALDHFKAASQLDPNFAAPHFQLYNAFREAGRKEDAARELSLFNEIKKRKAGAAVAEDPEWSFYAEIYDAVELDGAHEGRPSSPPLTFQTSNTGAKVDPDTAGMIVVDVDGDGQPDLLVWSQNGIILLKKGVTRVANTGLEGIQGVISVAAGDFNNDGFPDLAVLTRHGAALYTNHGSHFEKSPVKLPQGRFTKALWLDYDHDYDLDLLLLGADSVLLRNEGSAGFSDQSSRFPFIAGRANDAATLEVIPDTNTTDVAVLYEGGSIVVYRDKLMGHYQAMPQPLKVPGGTSIQAFDLNNDGWTDLMAGSSGRIHRLMNDHGRLVPGAVVSGENGPFVLADLVNRGFSDLVVPGSVFRNLGQGRLEKAQGASVPAATALAQADFDGDGRTELAAVAKTGEVMILKAGAAEKNTSIEVHLEGVKNLKTAVGSVVEVKAGALYQKKTYAGVPLVFGLRARDEVDTVRITWPNGLVQNEVKQPAGKRFSYKEKARLSGSCPMIFAWNGSRFGFVTDVLGTAPLGASNGDGLYFPVNHREHILIPEKALQPRGAHYEIRITEELREVSYLDKVQLIAVDHKAGTELFLNDKFKGPPFPAFRLFQVRKKTYPLSAKDDRRRELVDRITKSDGRYVDTFRRNAAGVGEVHSLTLDFGTAAPDNRAILVLSGWVDWPDGSTFLAAAQERKEGLIFPYLQVKDAAGEWKTVVADMGMPSGKPKSIVVDLTGKFLSRSREVRIVTNLCVYWDEIFLSERNGSPEVRMAPLQTVSADLRYRGFSKVNVPADRTRPEQFEYENWTPTSMWNPTPGLYTRYGEVRSLLESPDDRMAILGSGDEISLLFDRSRLAAVAPGWKRDFILVVDGWAKDADANTAYAKSVEPLPFHAMKHYPYGGSQHFPSDAAHQLYRKKFNTRTAVDDLGVLRPD